MRMTVVAAVAALLVGAVALATVPTCQATTHLKETFEDGAGWMQRWVHSEAKKAGVSDAIGKYNGQWKLKEDDNGARLVMAAAHKHYGLSRQLDTPVTFEDKDDDLIVQYEVRFEEPMECGGAYMKLLTNTDDLDLSQLTDKTPYTILFGPDKCGASNHLRFIYRFKHPVTGEYKEVHARQVSASESLLFSHTRTNLVALVLRPDNTFSLHINGEEVSRGVLTAKDDFDPALMPSPTIDDPTDFKPEDWDDREMIDDPEDVKPDDWDEDAPATIPDMDATMPPEWDESAPELIPDPEAVQPEDWDEEEDGEWEAPLVPNPACDTGCGPWVRPTIPNPAYKGKWKPRRINNPNYMGVWAPRQIPNPEHFEESDPFHKLAPIGAAAFELWTVTKGVSFSNILITSSHEGADALAQQWAEKRKAEDIASGEGGLAFQLELLLDELQDKPHLGIAATAVVGGIIALICLRKPRERPRATGVRRPQQQQQAEDDDEQEEEGNERQEREQDGGDDGDDGNEQDGAGDDDEGDDDDDDDEDEEEEEEENNEEE
ncbi:SmIrV1 protein [Salpingoeca rosetta]|uniref:SmIrV1 protein n=1 Tax=Salpingoeca rosetta (strain ATCC 50818 / BSB-021) TaxID=946362 RepID=F2U824_SALR5|nr:SmIrV1 protein [Salpingoeca rosetta]EGD72929.1 SmIrV1 protein [Salpingoeca rosetta]|eukprot:XP_004994751.1 SmIrV1 protein [Salpingoeca rosetta]